MYSPEQLADMLIEFKPRWIHDPRSMDHVRAIARALGCEPAKIHADVPKLRTAFPQGGLSTGIAYAFQAHRDTWYAAPKAQLNWWMPVWPVAENNIMEFYPHGFGTQVENNSGDYDYYLANTWRGNIKDFSGGKDARVHPAPVHGIPADATRLTVVPPLGGIMLFSGDQLHASIPNTSGMTRYSIDFRTVHVDDVHARRRRPGGGRRLHRHGPARLQAHDRRRVVHRGRGRALRQREPGERRGRQGVRPHQAEPPTCSRRAHRRGGRSGRRRDGRVAGSGGRAAGRSASRSSARSTARSSCGSRPAAWSCGVITTSMSGSTPRFSTSQPESSNHDAYRGWVTRVPSTSE